MQPSSAPGLMAGLPWNWTRNGCGSTGTDRSTAPAHRFEKLIRDGEVRDYADLARLGHVTRARLTQIMNLLNLAPDIQESILSLPAVRVGRDPVHERQLREIVAVADWRRQRSLWGKAQRIRSAGFLLENDGSRLR